MIMRIFINPKDQPKASWFCEEHLIFVKQISNFDVYKTDGSDKLLEFYEKAKIIKTHEILNCGGCENCNIK